MPEHFVASLGNYRADAVFNPWSEVDPDNDCAVSGPQIRKRQLLAYLEERIGIADSLLCAEAIGYQGGHFSGIPMTSERLLLGGLRHKQLVPEMVFREPAAQRTSRPEIRPNGFTEPTATIVWGFLQSQAIDPRRVVLWNAFPWHPYQPHKGFLSNRTPTDKELADGQRFLHDLLALGRFRQVIAVGEKSAAQLSRLGISARKVRHPANGGAGLFREQMLSLLGKR